MAFCTTLTKSASNTQTTASQNRFMCLVRPQARGPCYLLWCWPVLIGFFFLAPFFGDFWEFQNRLEPRSLLFVCKKATQSRNCQKDFATLQTDISDIEFSSAFISDWIPWELTGKKKAWDRKRSMTKLGKTVKVCISEQKQLQKLTPLPASRLLLLAWENNILEAQVDIRRKRSSSHIF